VEKTEIQRMFAWIQGRVRLVPDSDEPVISFDAPSADDFKENGFSDADITLTLESGWWRQMVIDIIETPEYAEPDESPEQVLKYARDVVVEYFRKRLGT
jgi:hypothetical protein